MGENYYIFKNATRIQRDGDGVDVVCASWGITVLGNIAYSVHLMKVKDTVIQNLPPQVSHLQFHSTLTTSCSH